MIPENEEMAFIPVEIAEPDIENLEIAKAKFIRTPETDAETKEDIPNVDTLTKTDELLLKDV